MKYIPVLANDRAVNDKDKDSEGRTDCVDNATNTTTFLRILAALGLLEGWRVADPHVRDAGSLVDVHWTAQIIDERSRDRWSVDSWFHAHGQLPFVMPLPDWTAGVKFAWESPFDRYNPYPRQVENLCLAEFVP